jgi:hypothetical protein
MVASKIFESECPKSRNPKYPEASDTFPLYKVVPILFLARGQK